MSRQNSTSSQKSENKDLDEIEEEFLKCNIEDLPIPKEELEDYEYEIKEVMKSGCNRQIAEYALLQYKINTELQKLKDDYIEELNKIKEKIKDSIDNYFNNKGNIVIKRDTLDSKKEYEEEAEKMRKKKKIRKKLKMPKKMKKKKRIRRKLKMMEKKKTQRKIRIQIMIMKK